MDNQTHILLATKILEICGCDKGAAIYSALPAIDREPDYFKGVYAHSIKTQPRILDSAIEIFTGKKTRAAKTSYEYKRIKEGENEFRSLLSKSKDILKSNEIIKISDDKTSAALSLISHLYFDTFIQPVQFFSPDSSICSGQWDFWNNINFLNLKEGFNKKEIIFSFREKMLESDIWKKTKFKPDDFPFIVKKRLLKEKAFDKNLNPESMIKAMIVRMGELGGLSINYEIVDFSIREFFTYLATKKYLRIDREVKFLKRLEKDMIKNIKEILNL